MQLTLMGSHYCEDTLAAMQTLAANQVEYEFVDISGQLEGLKRFLNARDGNPLFAQALGRGIGIPYFRFADGFETLELERALEHLGRQRPEV